MCESTESLWHGFSLQHHFTLTRAGVRPMCLSACVHEMYSSNMRGLPATAVSPCFLQQRHEHACAPWTMIFPAHSGVSHWWREGRAPALLSNAASSSRTILHHQPFTLCFILLDSSAPHCRKKDSGSMWKSPANGFFDKTKGRELHPADGMW